MMGRVAKVRWVVCSEWVSSKRAVIVGAIGIVWLGGVNLPALAGVSSLVMDSQQSRQEPQQLPSLASNDRLPHQVARQVRRDLARQLDVSWRELTIVSYSRQTWSDSCLGLGTAAESCAQALVPGWQIELTDGTQTWVYHTDETAQTMRLQQPVADTEATELPEMVGDQVLKAASEASGLPESELTLVAAKPQTWDGCLGIVDADGICTRIAISGWQVIVASETGSWVYHSDADGTEIRLNETASLPDTPANVGFIPADQIAPGFGEGVVFKAIVEGGITGSSSQVLLMEDGQVVQFADDQGVSTANCTTCSSSQVLLMEDGQVVQFADDQGVSTATELNRLNLEQVQAFVELLQQQRFSNLNDLSYVAPSGAADYRTVTLIGQGSTTQYADIVQDQLPSALQQVIQAWEQTISD